MIKGMGIYFARGYLRENIIRDKGFMLLVKLFKEAIKDGEIDKDEGEILRKTDLNINNVLEEVKKAWEDQILTDEEREKIGKLIECIHDDAVSVAEYDKIITQQERKLLGIIKNLIGDFYKESYWE